MKRHWIAFAIMFVFTWVIVGCSSEENEENEENVEATGSGLNNGAVPAIEDNNQSSQEDPNNGDEAEGEPVTLKWAWPRAEAEFIKDWKEPIEAALPHISLEVIMMEEEHGDVNEWQNLIAAGQTPDIITQPDYSILEELQLLFDFHDFLDEKNFDLSTIHQGYIDHLINVDDKLMGLPTSADAFALHYNKDIFDLFGVSYPSDDMTWDQILNLAVEVTGEQDGIEYRGLDLNYPSRALLQRSAQVIDPETYDVLISDNDDIHKYFELVDRVVSIPGNYPTANPGDLMRDGGSAFVDERNVAMLPLWNLIFWFSTVEDFNYDVVTFPTWDDLPNIAPNSGGQSITISAVSEYKDEAFEVIDYVLSVEFQKRQSRQSLPSPLVNQEVHDEFGADEGAYTGLNTQALFRHTPAPTPIKTKYDDGDVLWDGIIEFVNEASDVNTKLRELQERAEEAVRQQIASE